MRSVSQWLFPRHALWRLLLLLAVGNYLVGAFVWTMRPRMQRVTDEAGILDPGEIPRFNRFLGSIHDESGADIRFLFVRGVPNGDIETYALQRARAMGVGRDVDRRGMLFVYDLATQRMRIEVGPTLEGIFPDGFLGYLMREHTRVFFGVNDGDRARDLYAVSDPDLGLRTTLFMLLHRLREATLGKEYDPAWTAHVRDSVRLAAGGGATARAPLGDGSATFGRGPSSAAARKHFAPQPTVEEAHARFLEWLRDGASVTELPLFTSRSRDLLQSTPFSPGYVDYMLMGYYGEPYVVDVRDDLAMLVYTATPLQSPHFFRHSEAGWQMDLWAEVTNTRNGIGMPYIWSLHYSGDGFADAFADRYVRVGRAMRHVAGDNRPIPTGRQYPAGFVSALMGAGAIVLFWRNRRRRPHGTLMDDPRSIATFRSSRFPPPADPDALADPEDALVEWLVTELRRTTGFEIDPPEGEDWGTFVPVRRGRAAYELNIAIDDEGRGWLLEVQEPLSLLETFFRKRDANGRSELIEALHSVLRSDPGKSDLRWHRGSSFGEGNRSDGAPAPSDR